MSKFKVQIKEAVYGSTFLASDLAAQFRILVDQSVNPNNEVTLKKGLDDQSYYFTGIDATRVSIATRLNFVNRENEVVVENFPIYILAKKGFELNDVFENLPYRTWDEYDESENFVATHVRAWSEWHTENNTSVIGENEDYVLIRTAVMNKELNDSELQVLVNSSNRVASSELILTTNQFLLWGPKEFKEQKDIYFPIIEE